MGDMSKLEYVTTEWVEEMFMMADKLRSKAAALIDRADQIDDLRRAYEQRLQEHERWTAEPDTP